MPGSDRQEVAGFAGRFAAELITARTAELAEQAAEELLRSHREVAARYRPMAREKWSASLGSRLGDLSAALSAEDAGVFASQVSWSRVAFAARGAPVEDLRAGLTALRAVLAREVTPEDAGLVDRYMSRALEVLDGPEAASPPQQLSIASRHGRVGASYLVKILEGDRVAAAGVVHEAVKAGLPVREAYLEVLAPVLREIGRLWHLNEISVAEEHFATSTSMTVMSQLLALAERKPRNGLAVLTACVEGNTHELGARMVADFFEMEGWRSIHLGANVPAEDVVTAVSDFRVDVAALSLALVTQIPAAERTIGLVRHALGERRPRIIIGGGAMNACESAGVSRTVGADGYAAGPVEAVAEAQRLVAQSGRGQ